jgi:hypothetical protein
MAGLLGSFELTALRNAAEAAMPGTVVIYRRTLSSDGAGGQSGSVSAVGTVSARVISRHSDPVVMTAGGRIEARGDWYIYVPASTDIRGQSDYLVHQSGGTFDVLFTSKNRSYPVEIRAVCMERR